MSGRHVGGRGAGLDLSRREFIGYGSAAVAALGAIGMRPARADTTVFISPAVADKVRWREQPFALDRVRLLDGPFKQARDRDLRYMMSIPNDRLLHCFRTTAGLPSNAEPLGGWESPHCELRGHFSGGHYLSACALLVASTGDEGLRAKVNALVDGLAACQREDGYLGAYPASFYDRLGRREEVWVPIYTGHKLLAGQLDVFRLLGNTQSLDIARRFADWLGKWMDGFDDAQWQRILEVEFGGIQETLLDLYAMTGEENYRRWAARYQYAAFLDPLKQQRDELDGQHANTVIPRVVAAARAYELDGDEAQRGIAEFFWNTVTTHHAYCTGGTSDYERFGKPDQMAGKLSGHSEECCCTYNMLKLTRHLYGWQPNARLMDYYERALFNARMGTQDEAGMMMYFVPMGAGYWRLFNTPFDSFWCCTGTGSEDFAKLQDTIYFHDDDGLSVNLFVASQLDWRERGVRVTQATRFPEEQGTTLNFELRAPTEFALRLRIPGWVADGAAVLRINGKRQSETLVPGSYFTLRRRFVDGDSVQLELPMQLHPAPLADEPSLQAMMFGPLVLAVRMGTEGVPADKLHVSDQRPSLNHIVGREIPTVYFAPDKLWVEPGDAPLSFKAEGILGPFELVPFNRIVHERYAVYCRVRPEWEKNPQF